VSKEIKDIDDIIEETPEKESPLEDDYNSIKKPTFKVDKPHVEQFFDKRKIIGVLLIIAIISLVFVFAKPSKKQEETNEKNLNTAGKNTINVIEEAPKDNNESSNVDENNTQENPAQNTTETTSLDKYDDMLGDQYDDHETTADLSSSEINSTPQDNKKSWRKSSIEFKKNTGNTNTNSPNGNNTSSEQQPIIIPPQQQNQGGTQTVDTTPNRQESKQKFVDTKRSKSFYSANTVMPSLSRYEIKTGTMIPAVLLTSINSDLPGEILAQVTMDVHDFRTLKYTLIPKGSRLIGRYDSNITYGQNRLLVVWDRIIFPNGQTLLLDNFQGVDVLGNAGLKGKVNNHFWKLLRSIVLSAGINMAAGALESVNVNVNSSSRAKISVGAGTNDLARNVESIGSKIIDKDLNQQPTIQIKRGSRFNIFVNADMVLPVYKN
jgi:conjugation trbI family protein